MDQYSKKRVGCSCGEKGRQPSRKDRQRYSSTGSAQQRKAEETMEGKSQRRSLALNSGRTGVSLKRWLRRRRLSCLRCCICEYYCRWPQVCSCFCHSFSYIRVFNFLHWSTTLVHLSLLCEVPHSHSDTHHSVGLLCTNDRPDEGTTWIQECPICYLFIINFTRFRLLKLPPGCR